MRRLPDSEILKSVLTFFAVFLTLTLFARRRAAHHQIPRCLLYQIVYWKFWPEAVKMVNIDEIKTMHKSGMNWNSSAVGQSLFSLACRASMILFFSTFFSMFQKAGFVGSKFGKTQSSFNKLSLQIKAPDHMRVGAGRALICFQV